MIKIKRGLDIPISGSPEQIIEDGPAVRSVAVLGADYVGMKPTMQVKVGDKVKKGQVLFSDKKTEGVHFTAPAAGTIAAIHRGHKRVLQSVVIDVEGNEEETFAAFAPSELSNLGRDVVEDNLLKSGLWTALRTRPFSKVPAPGSEPSSLFVTAIDTNPLAVNPEVVIKEEVVAFQQGLDVLSCLCKKIWLCKAAGANIGGNGITEEVEFSGPHPAGLAGTHIHYLDPVSMGKTAWYINYQDVIAVGKQFTTGSLSTERVVALAGPQVAKPRLIKTRLGANLDELTAGEMLAGENRCISGSVLSGNIAHGPYAFLGRYHLQVTVLKEGRDRNLFEYLRLGVNKHSATNAYITSLTRNKLFDFTTTSNGSPRGMVPIGAYERIMPLDVLPTQLLRSLIVGDTQSAQELGCLELDEEDVALCTYVCPGKYEYGPILRDNLERIEKEG